MLQPHATCSRVRMYGRPGGSSATSGVAATSVARPVGSFRRSALRSHSSQYRMLRLLCGCVCVWMCECECECVCICLPVCACTCARELVSVMIELNGQPLGEPCGNRILRRRPDLPPPLVLTETKDDDQLLSRLCLLKGGNWFRRSGPEPKANGGRWLAHKSCD